MEFCEEHIAIEQWIWDKKDANSRLEMSYNCTPTPLHNQFPRYLYQYLPKLYCVYKSPGDIFKMQIMIK